MFSSSPVVGDGFQHLLNLWSSRMLSISLSLVSPVGVRRIEIRVSPLARC